MIKKIVAIIGLFSTLIGILALQYTTESITWLWLIFGFGLLYACIPNKS